jgi:hypothetical protein
MLRSRESDWVQGGFLSCHLYWHWALHVLELGDHQQVLHIFDNEIVKRCSSTAPLDLVDVNQSFNHLPANHFNPSFCA